MFKKISFGNYRTRYLCLLVELLQPNVEFFESLDTLHENSHIG